ncbi:hypothetical protein [Thermomonas brevis]
MRRNALSRFLAVCVFAAGACQLVACAPPKPPEEERRPEPQAAPAHAGATNAPPAAAVR